MKYIWFVIFTLSALTAFGQKSARVRQLEEQRKKALAEVEMTNQLLQETTQTAQNTLNRLNLLSQQILSRKKVISLLNQELGELDNKITASRREINKLEKELDGKRENYGKSMQSMYKRRSSQDKLLFILSADNFAQSMRRMRYLREYADWQKTNKPRSPSNRRNWKRHVPKRTHCWEPANRRAKSSRPRKAARKPKYSNSTKNKSS